MQRRVQFYMLLTTKQVREQYHISRHTLLNWEKEELLRPLKTPKGTRRYLKSDIEKLFGLIDKELSRKTILYARVSTKKQENYLKNQVERLEKQAKLTNEPYEIISEIASGVNENRRGLKKLLNQIKEGHVKKVMIEYPDRLARFGYEYLKFILDAYGVELEILHPQETEELQKELAEDLIAIVSSFAGRIYGHRGQKK
jgi:putative resolvase